MKLLLLLLAKPMLTLSGATAFFWVRPSSEPIGGVRFDAEAGAIIGGVQVEELLEAVPEDAVEVEPEPEPEAEPDKVEVEKK